MRPDFSIGQRLAAGFGLLVLLLATFLGLVMRWSAQAERAQDTFLQEALPWSEAAELLERRLLQLSIAVRGYLYRPGAAEEAAFGFRLEQVRGSLHALDRLPATPEDADGMRRIAPLVNHYLVTAERVTQQRAGSGPDPELEAGLVQARDEALEEVDRLQVLQDRKRDAALARLDAARTTAVRGVAVAGGGALIVFVLLGWITTQSIRRPSQDLIRISSAMERGDFRPALEAGDGPPQARDEMGRLRRAFHLAARALERRERRLRAEAEVAAATASGPDAGEITRAALPPIVEKVRAELGSIHVVVAPDRLLPLASRAYLPDPSGFAPGEGIPGAAALQRRTVIVRDIPPGGPLEVRLGPEVRSPTCVVAVPITFREELRGVLLVASLHDLDDYAVDFLEKSALQLGVGLQNAAAWEAEQRLLAEVREGNERIQAQNEELQVQAEEIQAQNEELQAQGEELLAQNEDLSRQGDELRLATQALAEADSRKNDFIGVLAHELRNPLASVSASLHLLRRPGVSGARAERALAIIDRQSQHLARLIGDLLDVTRITRGKVRLQRELLDLRDVVRACVDDHQAALDAAGLHLDLELPDAPAIVDGDATRLHQVASNLLGNAIKFTPRGGRILVLVREVREEISLHVVDTGAGITSDLLPEIFTPFRQGSTTLARSAGGLGLGLALVKALAELHGGRVEVRSEGPARGAEFTVTLPRSLATPAASPRPSLPAEAPAGSSHVLLVEDNRDAAESLQAALEMEGHEVEIAATGREALEKAARRPPDLVLCDIGLPHMDGFEVARAFRRHEALREVPLVALSGYASEADQQRSMEAGFDRHLAKPPDLDRLLSTVRELVRLAERAG